MSTTQTIIKIETGTIINERLMFEGLYDNLDIPCVYCCQNCECFGQPYPGDELTQIDHSMAWPARIDICNNVILEFKKLFINGELKTFDKKRNI